MIELALTFSELIIKHFPLRHCALALLALLLPEQAKLIPTEGLCTGYSHHLCVVPQIFLRVILSFILVCQMPSLQRGLPRHPAPLLSIPSFAFTPQLLLY